MMKKTALRTNGAGLLERKRVEYRSNWVQDAVDIVPIGVTSLRFPPDGRRLDRNRPRWAKTVVVYNKSGAMERPFWRHRHDRAGTGIRKNLFGDKK